MKQTAVEWLIEQLTESGKYPFIITDDITAIEKAKEMEKSQLGNFYMQGGVDAILEADRNFGDLYNETFKSE